MMFDKNGQMVNLGFNPFRNREPAQPKNSPWGNIWNKPFSIQEVEEQEQPLFQHGFMKHINYGLNNLWDKQIPENTNNNNNTTAGPIYNAVDNSMFGNTDMNDFYDYLNNYRYY